MAVVDPVTLTLSRGTRDFLGCVRIQYPNVKAGDTCTPVSLARFADRTVQISGDYSSATVAIHGTCEDDENYAVLTSDDGINLSFTSGIPIKFVTQVTSFTKPVISGGDVDTDVTITFICRGQVI